MVDSLAHPGGNLTGMSLLASDLWPKRLELLGEMLSKLTRAAMLWNKSNAGMGLEAKATLGSADKLGVVLQDRGMKDTSELETVLGVLTKERPDGLLAMMDLSLRHTKSGFLNFWSPIAFPRSLKIQVGWRPAV